MKNLKSHCQVKNHKIHKNPKMTLARQINVVDAEIHLPTPQIIALQEMKGVFHVILLGTFKSTAVQRQRKELLDKLKMMKTSF